MHLYNPLYHVSILVAGIQEEFFKLEHSKVVSQLQIDRMPSNFKYADYNMDKSGFKDRNATMDLESTSDAVFEILDSFLKEEKKSGLNIASSVAKRAGGNRLPILQESDDVFDENGKQQSGDRTFSGPLLSGLAYCISSCSMILLNKVVLSSYDFTAGISLMLYQNSICVLIVVALDFVGVISTEKLSWKLIRVWLPVNLIFVGMLVSGMYSLKNINVATVTILKNVTNVLTAIGETYMFGKHHNKRVWASLSLMIVSAISSGFTDLSFDAVGYAWQALNCILTASYSLTLRRVMDTAKQTTRSGSLNEVSMVLLNNAMSLPFAVLLIILFNEWGYISKVDVIRMPMFWVVATASGLLGLAISFTSMWFLNQTGPTTYSLVGSLNKIPISIAGILLFKVPSSLPNLFSILFGLLAGVFFAKAKMST